MKKFVLALTVTVLSLSATYSYAEVENVDVSEAVVEMDADADYAKLDEKIYCSVAMVNRNNRIVRRYNGRRSFRTFRCEGPMRQCRQDLRWSRRPFARCVELR